MRISAARSPSALPFAPVRARAMKPSPLSEERDVQALWNARASGPDAPCSRCKGHVGLSVSDLRSYRWRCMGCGSESPWFFVKNGAVRLHAYPRVWEQEPSCDGEP